MTAEQTMAPITMGNGEIIGHAKPDQIYLLGRNQVPCVVVRHDGREDGLPGFTVHNLATDGMPFAFEEIKADAISMAIVHLNA